MNKEKADEVRDRQRAWASAWGRDKLDLLRQGYSLGEIRNIMRRRQTGVRWQARRSSRGVNYC